MYNKGRPAQSRCAEHIMQAGLRALRFLVILLSLGLVSPVHAQTEPSILLVVFNQGKSHINDAYRDVIKGIERHSELRVVEQTVEPSVSETEINSLVSEHNAAAIILLGSKTISYFDGKNISVPVITGGTLYPNTHDTQHYHGLSLTPSPKLLFSKLKEYKGDDVKRVHVVYNPTKYQWLIDIANTDAEELDIELISYKADDLRSSAQLHRNIIESDLKKNESIWLLHDSALIGETNVLPYILKEAWSREITVFSSNPQHVQRGAFLSLYAEKEISGVELGNLAKRIVREKDVPNTRFHPATQLKTAINIRSAGHLGIRLNSEQLKNIGLIFPRR